jgi:hypothetical protein
MFSCGRSSSPAPRATTARPELHGQPQQDAGATTGREWPARVRRRAILLAVALAALATPARAGDEQVAEFAAAPGRAQPAVPAVPPAETAVRRSNPAANPSNRTLTFVIELTSADRVRRPAWQIAALSTVLPADVAGDRLRRLPPGAAVAAAAEAVSPGETSQPTAGAAPPTAATAAAPAAPLVPCAGRSPCTPAGYRAAGVDLVVRCQLTATSLRYQLWWLDGAVDQLRLDGVGEIDLLEGTQSTVATALVPSIRFDRHTLGQALNDAINDVRRTQAIALAARAAAPAQVAAPDLPRILVALAAVTLLFLLPLLVGVGLRLGARRLLRLRSLRVSAGALGAAGLAVAGLGFAGDSVTSTPTTVFILAGLAWGTLAIGLVPAALPPLLGLSRVQHHELFWVMTCWLATAWRRCLAVGVAALAAVSAALAGAAALQLSTALTWSLAMPLVALSLWHAARAFVEVLALRLDDRYVEGHASAEEPWHLAVSGYVRGYFRRAGLAAQDRLLHNVWFLPGTQPGIVVYGGGLTVARVVIERGLLEAALAPYDRPHDYATPRMSTLHWMQWNTGLVVPVEIGSPVATRSQRQPRELVVEGDTDHQPLGEAVTLAGVVEPARLDPRVQFRPHEDTTWLAWDSGEEHDGTDGGDKDWLFGAMVVALGAIHRQESLMATVRLWWRSRRPPAARSSRALGRLFRSLVVYWDRGALRLGDAQATLHSARHHLVQYLALQLWLRNDLMTARAYPPELERSSFAIYRILAIADADRRDAAIRLRWLQPQMLVEPRRVSTAGEHSMVALRFAGRRRWLVLAALASVLAILGITIADAMRFHPVYERRLESGALRSSVDERSKDHGQR